MSMGYRLLKLKQLMTGWVQYYKLAQMKSLLIQIDEWTRRRLRAVRWKEWKKVKTKYKNLKSLGVTDWIAWEHANSRKKYWRISLSWVLTKTLTNQYWKNQGYKSFYDYYSEVKIYT